MHPRSLRCALLLALATAAPVSAQQPGLPVLVEMERLRPYELRMTTFTLTQPQAIDIEATGADERFPKRGALSAIGRMVGVDFESSRRDHGWRGNAWILDAATRKVVWELRDSRTDRSRDGLRSFAGTVALPPGTYEAYYSSFTSTRGGATLSTAGPGGTQRVVRYDDDGFSRNLGFTIRGHGTAAKPTGGVGAAFQRNTIVSLTGIPAGETRSAGIVLTRPVTVEVYALGEAQGRDAFDHGWIMNADTRERVWTYSPDSARHAGGGAKNRMQRTIVALPAGRYVASYMMDSSHDPSLWNAAPPHDPAFWGLTIRVIDEADRAHVRGFTYESVPRDAVVSLNRLGNDEWKSVGFTVSRPVDVRILALGEGRGERMEDYGWIMDARTRQRVWTMAHEGTVHGGGSTRNRLAHEVIRLEPGSYVASFRTDGSHAFDSWTSSAPMDAELWGLTVVPVNPADRSAFGEYDEAAAGGDVVVRLIGMADGEDARATFSLAEAGNVRVYALGEGSDGRMHDYGWIEDRDTKQVVWEMTYRLTTHAGGSSKNRQFNGVVYLPAGSYMLRYRSDDSHSSARWNSDMPDDPASYGITLYRQ